MFLPIILCAFLAATYTTHTRQIHDPFVLGYNHEQLKFLSSLSSHDTSLSLNHSSSLLKPLLVPRVPDTPSNRAVQAFITKHFENLGWTIERDAFEAQTPLGTKHFTNLIFTHNPRALRKLVLAAHYDSKVFDGFEFVGATDSSVPCAILLDIAQTLNPYLPQSFKDGLVSLQLIFFDGNSKSL